MQKEVSFFVPMAQNAEISVEMKDKISKIEGVYQVEVNQQQKKCSVFYDNHECEEEKIHDLLSRIGLDFYFICRKDVMKQLTSKQN